MLELITEAAPTLRIALVIVHVIGAVLGAGGATASDLIFFKSISDGIISKTEFIFLKTVSVLVWTGLIILTISGVGFVALASLQSPNIGDVYPLSKLITKIFVVIVITLNGVFLHLKILPLFQAHLDQPLGTPSFRKRMPLVFTSGAISAASWYTALILGAWRAYPFSLTTTLLGYAVVLTIAITTANILSFMMARSFKNKFHGLELEESLRNQKPH